MVGNLGDFGLPELCNDTTRVKFIAVTLLNELRTKLVQLVRTNRHGLEVTGYTLYYSKDLYNVLQEVTKVWDLPVHCEIDTKLPRNTLRVAALVE